MANKFHRLFNPLQVGHMELPNRLVMLAVGTDFTNETGGLDIRQEAFLEARAKGGAGLIISPFSPCCIEHWLIPGLDDDQFIGPLRNLAQKIHNHGSKFVVQLTTNVEWSWERGSKMEMVSPSGVKKRGGLPIRPLTIEEIRRLVTQFGEAARRASEAGCDGAEIHGGVGYLVAQFISPVTNQRTDEYGGSMEKRMRFPLEIIAAIKNKAGRDFSCLFRMSAEEFMEGGLTIKETSEYAKMLEAAGVDCLNVQAGWHESRRPLVQSCVPPGAYVYLAEAIKRVVNIPVIAAYRIKRPELAEEIVSQGRADLVGMARQLIADPELPMKAREGRENEIRPCITCNHCLDRLLFMNSLECSVNPLVGREAEWIANPASPVKKVLVVGGGPAGMVAASTAAKRGHEVTLYEKGSEMGGQLNYAWRPCDKQEIEDYRQYLKEEVLRSGVKIRLNAQADIQKEKPDTVVVAVGAQPFIPAIPGVQKCVSALEVLTGKETGENVIIIGGGLIGCETADYLSYRGKKVVILEMLESIGADIGPTSRWVLLGKLKSAGVRFEPGTKVIAVAENGVTMERGGKVEELAADTVVLAAGMVSVKEALGDMKVSEVHRIGDCVSARRIRQAVEEGTKVGLEI
ncbi:MAG: FAD-dependent oxidoreductase [Syntrophales bacterium]|nr:FAD-dependent oxidoreductase [Syntrophales bacterium]